MEATVGGIINKFKGKSRRNTFFFDEITLRYVRLCEDNGYEKELKDLCEQWGFMLFGQVLPTAIKKLPYQISCNLLIRKILKNLGYMDDIHFIKQGDIVTIKTKNEENIKIIGVNNLHIGLYTGLLAVIFNSKVEPLDVKEKSNGDCEYVFKILNMPVSVKTKDKAIYDKLNYLPPEKGFTLKDALKSAMFQMKGNKIYFRGKRITAVENTLFHVFGKQKILFEKVPQISYEYFKDIIKQDSLDEEKLTLLKTLLQSMGWGRVKIIILDKKNIIFQIDNLPYGFQLGDDNWDFLIRTILGYLWLLDNNFKIANVKEIHKGVSITYSAG